MKIYYLGLIILVALMGIFGTAVAFGVPLPFLNRPLFQDNNAQYIIAAFATPAAPFVGEPIPPTHYITNVPNPKYTGASLSAPAGTKPGTAILAAAATATMPFVAPGAPTAFELTKAANPFRPERSAVLSNTAQAFPSTLYNMIDYSKDLVMGRIL